MVPTAPEPRRRANDQQLLLTGLSVCIVTAGTSYGVVYWKENGSLIPAGDGARGEPAAAERPSRSACPMVENGNVQGYIVARFAYTVDARAMSQLSVPPRSFVVDEAFRKIYADEQLDFRKLARYDLSQLRTTVKQRVNERMQAAVIQDLADRGLQLRLAGRIPAQALIFRADSRKAAARVRQARGLAYAIWCPA